MKTVEQIITDTLAADNHDERYLYGRFHGFYSNGKHVNLRLLEAGLLTCEDFPDAARCCDTCHTFYTVYEMELLETNRGWAWICCAVKRRLFPRDPNAPVTEEEKLLRKIFGEHELRGIER